MPKKPPRNTKGKHAQAAAQGGGVAAPPECRDDGILAHELVTWYLRTRRDLPWRRTCDPYAIWVSETMLQQTRVETVIPYYERFLAAFPTVECLAAAPLDSVLREWSGLGYYRRARFLHEGATDLVKNHAGKLPRTVSELETVRGIGPYTAGALASIAFGAKAALVDGNVHRVLARIGGDRSASELARKNAWHRAATLVQQTDVPGDLNQGLMELGATVCTPKPRCELCPWQHRCCAYRDGLTLEIPQSKKRNAPKEEAFASIIVMTAGGRDLWVCRRRAALRFGGLWEPPMLANEQAQELVALLSLRALKPLGELVHKLTHRTLNVHIFRPARAIALASLRKHLLASAPALSVLLADYDETAVVPLTGLPELAWSTLARNILKFADVPV